MLVEAAAPGVPGAGVIAEYLDETRGAGLGERRLMPDDPRGRVEVRRLMNWFNVKFFYEASSWLVAEKIYKRFMPATQRAAARPTWRRFARRARMCAIICAISGISSARVTGWPGDRLSFADLAAAAHLSSIDYLGDVPWAEDETAKNWYARVKSRPSFRPLLADRMRGHDAGRGLRQSRFLDDLRAKARALGFDLCRIAAPRFSDAASGHLARWIAEGEHGDMDWMARTLRAPRRSARLWSEVRSVVMLGVNYGPRGDPMARARRPRTSASFRSMRAIATITIF